VKAMFSRRIMTAGTLVNAKTVRIEPPAVLSEESIQKVFTALEESLAEVKAEFNL